MRTAALIIDGPEGYHADKPVAGILPLRRLVLVFKNAGINRVVIAGDNIIDEAKLHATRIGAEFMFGKETQTKSISLMTNTFNHLRSMCDRVLITPANFPLFDIPTIQRLIESTCDVAIPTYNDERGFPILVSAEYFNELIALDGDPTSFLSYHAAELIPVDDPGVTTDVSTDIDVTPIFEKLTLLQKMRPQFKLTISREEPFYGPGIQELIRLVDEINSLHLAAETFGMSYSYLLKIIKRAEIGLGFTLFKREPTAYYSGSAATKPAREFADTYDAWKNDCEWYIQAAFERYFAKFIDTKYWPDARPTPYHAPYHASKRKRR